MEFGVLCIKSVYNVEICTLDFRVYFHEVGRRETKVVSQWVPTIHEEPATEKSNMS